MTTTTLTKFYSGAAPGTTVSAVTGNVAWTQRALPTNANWTSVTYGNGLFVVVGGASAATSPDGVTWTQQTIPVAPYIAVTYGGGNFVAITGYNGGNAIAATSPDGVTWTQRTFPGGTAWWTVTYGGGKYIAFGSNGNGASSTDGITWTSIAVLTSHYAGSTYGNGLFVAVAGAGSTPSTVAATSPDGIAWTSRTLPASLTWSSVTYGNGLFVAVASGSTTAASSPDGITWTARTMPVSTTWQSVTYGNGLFVAISSATDNIIATSPDGVTWTQRALPATASWVSVAYGNGMFMAVSSGTIAAATSPSGSSLYTVPTATTSVVTNLELVNPLSTSAIFIVRADGVTFVYQSVPANSRASVDAKQVLYAGSVISALSLANNGLIHVNGVAIT